MEVHAQRATPIIENDYSHSANSLFHFMNKIEYLKDALKLGALTPRYCREDISYLGLKKNGVLFNEIAVLQKCFCDIPLHSIVEPYNDIYIEGNVPKEIRESYRADNHTSCYGEYAIAFSKAWCESNSFQPIHYINPQSTFAVDLSVSLNHALNSNELDDIYYIDVLQRLAFIKPLRGRMKRTRYDSKGNALDLIINKNFHDEQEWRFVPDFKMIEDFNQRETYQLFPVIANPTLLELSHLGKKSYINLQSLEIASDKCKEFRLNFLFDDVKYIIVSNKQDRISMITFINELSVSEIDRMLLISKLLVLDDIRKDW